MDQIGCAESTWFRVKIRLFRGAPKQPAPWCCARWGRLSQERQPGHCSQLMVLYFVPCMLPFTVKITVSTPMGSTATDQGLVFHIIMDTWSLPGFRGIIFPDPQETDIPTLITGPNPGILPGTLLFVDTPGSSPEGLRPQPLTPPSASTEILTPLWRQEGRSRTWIWMMMPPWFQGFLPQDQKSLLTLIKRTLRSSL